jgi:hypothetical protein
MSSPAPWAPTQGSPATQADPSKPNGPAPQQQVPSDAPQELIDENDPRLISESLDANLEADAYAQPAPPPDGKYRAKLKLEGVAQEGVQERKPYGTGANRQKVPYFKTGLSCSIIDPSGKYDGIVCYPAFGGGANTDRRRDGSTQVTTILTRLKKPDGTPWAAAGMKMSQLEWIQLLVKALGTEPEIGIETAWEASCMACATELKPSGKYALRTTGMHHFPQETDGAKRKAGQQFQPEIKCAANPGHGYARARAIVIKFLHLSELK